MKIWAYIKKDLRLFKKDLVSSVLILFVFPIALSFFYGFFQGKMFETTSKIHKFTIAIEDKDNSESSKIVRGIFNNEELKDIVEVEEVDTDVAILIPKGFEESLKAGTATNIQVRQIKKEAQLQTHIVQGILDSFAKNITIVNGVNKNINQSNLSEVEKQELMVSYSAKFSELFNNSAIKEDTLALNNRLNSIEYYSISILTFVVVLIIVSYSTEFIKERKDGTYRRIFSIALNGGSLYLGKVGSLFITSTLSVLSYVLFYRIIGKGFHGNFMLLMLAVFTTGLMIASLAGLAISIFRDEKIARIILTSLMMVCITIGGVFFPIDIIDNKFISIASKLTPNLWVADMFKKLALYNNFSAMLPSLIVISSMILISFIIGSLKMNKSFE
jgi:ABC-2 type transport system permease protein